MFQWRSQFKIMRNSGAIEDISGEGNVLRKFVHHDLCQLLLILKLMTVLIAQ